MKGGLLLGLLAIAITGCATPSSEQPIGQYCYTDEKIVKQNNETVSSRSIVSCSDRPKTNHVTRSAGVAQECRTYTTTINRNGVRKNVKGFLCRFPGGVWEPVNDVYAY